MGHFYTYWLLGGFLALGKPALAQMGSVGIGTTAPDASAALDIVSSSKGALLPRLSAAARLSIARPASGLLVYQADTPTSGPGTGTSAGFYYNAGTVTTPNWQQLVTATGTVSMASNGLTKTGTTVTLGGPLTGSTEVGLNGQNLSFSGNGNLGIGTTGPLTRFSISPAATEPKLTLFDGGSTTAHYGLGVSEGQLNYHVLTSSDRHVFYAAGKNGDGKELLRIQGNGRVGIGTATPSSTLDLRTSDKTAALTIGRTDNSAGAVYLGNTNHGLKRNYDDVSNDVGLYTTDGGIILSASGPTTSPVVVTSAGTMGVGTANPVASAALEVRSTDKGLLMPRMTTDQMQAIAAPEEGMMIYNTTEHRFYGYSIGNDVIGSEANFNSTGTETINQTNSFVQSFRVNRDNLVLLAVTIYPQNASLRAFASENANLRLQVVEGVNFGTPVRTRNISVTLRNVGASGGEEVVFGQPLPLQAGLTYHLNLQRISQGDLSIQYDSNNPYPNGALTLSGRNQDYDMRFKLTVTTPSWVPLH